jgi:hypothetical protein
MWYRTPGTQARIDFPVSRANPIEERTEAAPSNEPFNRQLRAVPSQTVAF